MAYQQKNLSGSLWKNDKKREGKKDADYNGSCLINGEEFWMDSWIVNDPRDKSTYDPQKKTFQSISFRPKDAAPHRQAKPDPDKRQHDLSKPRHMPPPPLHQSTKPEPKLDPVDPVTGEYQFEPDEHQ